MFGARSQRRLPVLAIGSLLVFSAHLLAQPNCEPPAELQGPLATGPSAEVYNALGGWYAGRGQSECAADAFRRSIDLDREYWEPRFNLGLLLAQSGKPLEASRHLGAAVNLNPESFEGNLAWGFTLLESEDSAAAEAAIGKALSLRPDSAQALYGMARVRMRQQRSSAALSYLEGAREIDPRSAEIPMMMGAALAAEGRYREATEVLSDVVEAHPSLPGAHFNLATAYARTEKR